MDLYLFDVHARVAKVFKRSLVIAAVSILAVHAVPAEAQRFTTFGKTTASGSTPTSGLIADFKRGSRFTTTESATVKDLCVYLDGNGGGAGTQSVQTLIYSDINGVPGKKLVDGVSWTIHDHAAAQWYCRPAEYVAVLRPGKYWVAILTSGPDSVLRAYTSGATQNLYSAADSYSDGPAATFGSGSVEAGTLAAYATYYPSSQIRNAGKMTIGAQPSYGMEAYYKRVSSFVMPEAGKLWAINAYLDGFGQGAPDVTGEFRYILYNDANGVPGDKVYEGDYRPMRGTTPAKWNSEWVQFNFNPNNRPTLTAGRYWVGFFSGFTANSTIRYYYDHISTPNWYGNDEAFNLQASSPFGPATAKNDSITAYVSYRPGPPASGELGRTDIGSTASRPLDANVTRWSAFDFRDTNATVTSLHAYLDGLGATSGSQDLRMMLYELRPNNDGSNSYYKIAQSEVVTIAAGMPKHWVDFNVPPAPITEFSDRPLYLIGIQSGPNPVARI